MKSINYFLAASVFTLLAAGSVVLSSCSKDDDESTDDVYRISTGESLSLSMSSSSGSTSYDPMEELTAVSNAFVAEFGGDTFTLKGDRATNDADVIKRFEKVASAYKMKDGVVGYLDVKVYRGDALLSTYRIENHAYTYDLCIDDFSDDLDITVMNAVYAQLKAGMPMQRDETEFVLYAANETLADATAKSLYEAQIPLVKLSDDWSDSDFLTVELDRLVDKENLVVVDSHTFKK